MEAFWIPFVGFYFFFCAAMLLLMIAPVALIIYIVRKLDMRKGTPFSAEFNLGLPVEQARQHVMDNLRGASILSLENPVFLPQGENMLTVNRKFIPDWAVVVSCILVFFGVWIAAALLLVNENEALNIQFIPDADGQQTRVAASGFASTTQREKLMQMAGISVQSNKQDYETFMPQ